MRATSLFLDLKPKPDQVSRSDIPEREPIMFDKLKQKLSILKTKQAKTTGQSAQSLVEIAISAPLLLLLFIGVFEVGWAIRGYLVLANANRESARFAVKNAVLDYSIKNPTTVGYDKVLSHTTASLSSQLPLEFVAANPNSTMILSHIVIDTGFPCVEYQGGEPKVPYEFDTACDCDEDDPTDSQWFTRDDLVLHPDTPGYSYYAQTFGVNRATRIGDGSYQAEADKLTLENNQFNCSVLKTGSAGELSINNVFIAEAFYDQPQLLGVPFVSNSLTDPIPFYTHTAMRIVTSREAESSDTIGPTCELFPTTFPEDIFSDLGYDPDNPPAGTPIDAFESRGSGNFGWLSWDPDPSHNNAVYIGEELLNPRLSIHDYTDPTDPDDHSINIDGWVSSNPGVNASNEHLLQQYVGRTVLIPVFENDNGAHGQNLNYQISHFARVTINEICFPNSVCTRGDYSGGADGKLIRATFLGYADDACTDGSGGGGGAPGNNLPDAVDDSVSTTKNTSITIDVLNNDSDPDGDTITVFEVTEESNPFKGTIEIVNGNTAVKYTADNHAGVYTFRYAIIDGNGGSDTALVTVTVSNSANNPPVANDDTYSTNQDTPLTVAADGVLGNDTDAESDPLTAAKVSDPSDGSVTLNADGSFTYTPDSGFSGTDTFTYQANDGTDDSNVATVTITVAAVVNNPPVANNDAYSVPHDTTLSVAADGVLGNDTDAESDPLTAAKETDPSHGSVTLNADGSFTYTPDGSFSGADTFTYKANDGTSDSNVATVTITVIGNSVPVAVNDTYTTSEDTPLNVAADGVLGNDTDANSDPLTAAKETDPTHGILSFNADGSFTYTPNAGWSGTDTFTYKANDGMDYSASPATVSLIVNPVNDPPVAVNDAYDAVQDTPLSVDAAGGVLANDSDPDTVVLHAVLVSGPSKASSFTLNDDGSFNYTPNAGGTDGFTYKVNDGTLDSNVAMVNFTIEAATPVLTTIYSEDFESSLGGEWSLGSKTSVVTRNSPHGPTHHLEMLKKSEGTLSVNMSGVTGAQLDFYWKAKSFDNSSETAEVSVYDGTGWYVVKTINNGEDDNAYHAASIDLSGYSMIEGFQVQFKINGSGTADYFYIDDIEITGYN